MSVYRHVVIGRRDARVGHVWHRLDFADGRFFDPMQAGGPGNGYCVVVQTSLHGLIEMVIGELRGADLTLSPRPATAIVQRGDPQTLDVPGHAQLELLCPLRAGDPSMWVRVLVLPSTGLIRVMHERRFVAQRLTQELRAILSPVDIESRNKLSDVRELWVRHGLSADKIAPDQVPPIVQNDEQAALAQQETREETARKMARAERAKQASHSSAAAMEFNRAEAQKHGDKVRAKLRAARQAK